MIEVKKTSIVALILPLSSRKLLFEGRHALILSHVFAHSYLLNKKTCDIRGKEKKRLPVDADFVDTRGNKQTYNRLNHIDILLVLIYEQIRRISEDYS